MTNDEHNQITTVTELITPDLAYQYLRHSTENRKIRWDVVGRLVRIIRRGEWEVTPDGIAFDTNGRLVNGHHRLHAIIEADTAVYMRVTRRLSPTAWYGIDLGVARTVSDVTGLDRKEVDVAQFFIQTTGGRHGSPGEVLAVATPVHDIQQLFHEAFPKWKKRLTAPVRAAFVMAAYTGVRPLDKLVDLFSAYGRADFNNLPLSMQALYRQLNEGVHSGGGRQVAGRRRLDYVRTLIALNPKRENVSRLYVASVDKYIAQVKEIFIPFLRDAETRARAETKEVVYDKEPVTGPKEETLRRNNLADQTS